MIALLERLEQIIERALCKLFGHKPRALESKHFRYMMVYCARCGVTMYYDGGNEPL